MMNGATSFINKTLNDVLVVHEIEEGALQIAKKAFHIEAVVADSIRASRGLLQKNVKLVLDDTDCSSFDSRDCPLLLGDRLRLQNVVMSFIENAVKLSRPKSSVTIKITKNYSDIYFPLSRVNRVMTVIANNTSHERKSNADDVQSPRHPAVTSTVIGDGVDKVNREADLGFTPQNLDEVVPTGCLGGSPGKFKQPPIQSAEEQHCEVPRPHYRSPTSVATRMCEVRVTVSDTGSGLSKEDLEGLLRPYSQIRPDYFEEGRGTGLWLVLAKEIINLHGGELIADSVVGRGSTFGFNIPFDIATRAQERSAELLQIVNLTSDRLLESNQEVEEATRPAEPTRKYLVVDGASNRLLCCAVLCCA